MTLTVWLSMIPSVGLASRPWCSRTAMSSAWCNRDLREDNACGLDESRILVLPLRAATGCECNAACAARIVSGSGHGPTIQGDQLMTPY